jgi:hypothetical protein
MPSGRGACARVLPQAPSAQPAEAATGQRRARGRGRQQGGGSSPLGWLAAARCYFQRMAIDSHLANRGPSDPDADGLLDDGPLLPEHWGGRLLRSRLMQGGFPRSRCLLNCGSHGCDFGFSPCACALRIGSRMYRATCFIQGSAVAFSQPRLAGRRILRTTPYHATCSKGCDMVRCAAILCHVGQQAIL